MNLNLTKVSVDSVAELMQRKPQKLRSQFEKVGLMIPEDGILDFEDVCLGLMELGEDWDEILGPIEMVGVDTATQKDRQPRLYIDLAEIELEQVTENLVSPSKPDQVVKLGRFLDANDEHELAARIWSTAYTAADSVFESECKTHYATSRAKALIKAENYKHAAEMAFAALACSFKSCPLERNDERAILYFWAILSSQGVVSESSWKDCTVEELILMGFQAEQIKAINRFRQATRRTLFLYENFFERLKLSQKTRVVLRKNFDVLKSDFKLPPDFQGMDLYSHLATEITQHIRSLKSIAEAFLSSKGYSGITQHRPRLIARIKQIRPFATPEELEVIDGLLELLDKHLTELGKQREGESVREYGQVHNRLLDMSSNLEQQIEARPGWLSSCYLLPILNWLRALATS